MNQSQVSTFAIIIYGIYACIATLYPFEFAQDPSHSVASAIAQAFERFGAADFIVNVLLFIPFGALFCCLWSSGRRRTFAICLATMSGAIASLSIELLQIWFTRQPSGFDVLSNTVGAATGAVLTRRYLAGCSGIVIGYLQKVKTSRVLFCLALLLGGVPLLLSIAQLIAPFGVWNSRFTFQIGNEATYNRPWLGKFHLVALYSRALSGDEVARHFHQGPSSLRRLSSENLVALYAFNERSGNIVRDMSGVDPAIDLSFSPKGRVRWLDSGNGIEIVKPSIVRSSNPATKLFEALRATHELSIEVWITPDNAMQRGPARIVSFSRDTRARNFTLGQQGPGIELRVRTPVSGMNGTPLALKSGNEIAAGKQAQVVATYENGVEKLYINGRQEVETLNLPSDGIIGFGTRRTPITRIAYSFFYIFPVSLFLALYFRQRAGQISGGLLLPVAVAAGLALVSEGFQALAFNRFIDIWLLIAATIIALLGGLSGHILSAVHWASHNSLEELH